MKLWMLAASFALVLGAGGCSNDSSDGPGTGVTEGADTYVKVSVTAPATYADNPANGTTEESSFSTMDVFIYNSDGNLSTSSRLTQFTLSNGVWESDNTVAAKTGDSRIFIAVNLDDATRSALLAGTISALDVDYATTIATLASDNSFIMTTTDYITRTLEEYDPLTDPIPAANQISATVTRLAAKVTVEKAAGLAVTGIDGGQFDPNEFEFGVGQLNESVLYRQATAGVGANHSKTFTAGQTADGLTGIPDAYISLNEAGVGTANDYKELDALYVPENTNDVSGGTPRAGNLTYIAVKAEFFPDQEATYTGSTLATANNAIGNKGTTFYMVKVIDNNNSGETLNLYFYDENEANDFINDGGYSGGSVDYTVAVTNPVEYVDAVCYYTVYMNMGNEYDVYRNDFYRSTVTKIAGLGDPAPGPIDPDLPPADKRTDIEISIDVEPWNLVNSYDELTPQS